MSKEIKEVIGTAVERVVQAFQEKGINLRKEAGQFVIMGSAPARAYMPASPERLEQMDTYEYVDHLASSLLVPALVDYAGASIALAYKQQTPDPVPPGVRASMIMDEDTARAEIGLPPRKELPEEVRGAKRQVEDELGPVIKRQSGGSEGQDARRAELVRLMEDKVQEAIRENFPGRGRK